MAIREVSNREDTLDSRDINDRYQELLDAVADEDYDHEDDEQVAEELEILSELISDGENYSEDWLHGATLIHEDYFKTYAQELAEDVGYGDHTDSWPYNCIDWEKAANELKMDYTEVDFDGVAYYVR